MRFVFSPHGSMVCYSFPFRSLCVERSDDLYFFRGAHVEYVINPGAIVEFMTACDEGLIDMI